MTLFSSPVLCSVGTPLFGSIWLAMLLILACVAGLLTATALFGRWLAATHPEAPAKTVTTTHVPSSAMPEIPGPEVLAVISASVVTVLGPQAKVVGVQSFQTPNVEALMQQWSVEGRRQVYSSHKVR